MNQRPANIFRRLWANFEHYKREREKEDLDRHLLTVRIVEL